MSKIVGIGETILDITFKENKPTNAVVGGSVFNALVSLSRLGHQTAMISEIGRDRVGQMIIAFMQENGMTTAHIDHFTEGQSPIAMAFLDQEKNAEYLFYKLYSHHRLRVLFPKIERQDYLLFGSYYALNPEIRRAVKDILEYAREREAFMLYDPNFRKSHIHDALKLMLFVAENMEYADLVRCSDEDCQNLYKTDDIDKVYKNHIAFYCPYFICTESAKGVRLYTPTLKKSYSVPVITVVSSVAAGDNFNAGLLHSLKQLGVTRQTLKCLSESQWDKIIETAILFSQQVCQQEDNYLSQEFCTELKGEP